ncbi:MAG: hypothetical protein FP820_05810 [Sulfurimonas sp.]|nr:hypothetical protein [Sulfurimonas sp.]MBU4060217.1 hypothetical protein [bacterium]
MNYETLKSELLKQARNAFETASTLRETQRIEVYKYNTQVITSDVLEEDEEILYTPEKILCYQIYGYDHLEDEIKTWIDFAREITQPTDEMPLSEPTDIEKSIRELVSEIAKRNGAQTHEVSSYEVFANIPVTLLGTIEQEIIEYWWNAKEEENAKKLALAQIEEVIGVQK